MILFDYSKAMAQVRELRRIAEDMARMRTQKLNTTIEGIHNSWKGQTSKSFLVKCDELGANIDKEVQNIRQVADLLENKANIIEREEKEAARILAN